MAAAQEFDVIFVGSGPGGYVGAIRCAQLGFKTAMVEKDKTFGGTCLNVGCIPSKALLQSSEVFAAAQHDHQDHGVEVSSVKLNLKRMMERKTGIVSSLTGGIGLLFEKNKIATFQGLGSLKDEHTVLVKGPEGSVELRAKNIVIASGSVPVELPHLPFDGKNIVSSSEALSFSKVPKRLAVVGGGVIGLELGSVWSRLGSEVTVFEYSDRLLAGMDGQIAKDVARMLKKQGLNFVTGAKVTGAKTKGDEVTLTYDNSEGSHEFKADKVLVAVGRKAFTEGLNLEQVGVKLDERSRVAVDEHLRTSIPHIFAIGDVIAGPMLAHKAEEEGVAVAEFLATGYGHVNYGCIPSVIYTWPEVASVGATEEELKSQGRDYLVGSFPFAASSRAKALGASEGRVKILADAQTDKILGAHMVGPNVSELIHEVIVAMEFGGSSEDLARSFHAHPTLSEAVREAALSVQGRVRQIPPQTRR